MLGPSVYIIRPTSPKGKAWLDENVPDGTWAMGGIVVEWRYMDDIWDGVKAEGLETEFEVVS